MGTKIGTIWAQSLWWDSTSSSNSRHIVFAAPRHITAYSTLSRFYFGLLEDPPSLCYGETGIAWYHTLDSGILHRHPAEGDFNPLLPYIQADNTTEMMFRLKAGVLSDDGFCQIRVKHMINYFE